MHDVRAVRDIDSYSVHSTCGVTSVAAVPSTAIS